MDKRLEEGFNQEHYREFLLGLTRITRAYNCCIINWASSDYIIGEYPPYEFRSIFLN